jgi:type I restriction enzyme, S subunit
MKSKRIAYLPEIVKNERNSIRRGPFGSSLRKNIFVKQGFKVYEQKHVINNDFEIGDYYIDQVVFKKLEDFEVKPNDILISCSGTIGKIVVAPYDIKRGIINQALLKLTFNPDKISNQYFIYFFNNYVNQGELKNQGAAIKNIISVKDLKKIPIPLPPLPEQHRIVAKLDRVFERIDKAIALVEQSITNARHLMASVLNEVFENAKSENWQTCTLNEVILKIQTGTTPPSQIKNFYEDGDVNWFTPSDFGKTMVLEDSSRKVTQLAIEKNKARLYPSNTLLLVAIGATIGKIGVIKKQSSSNQQITGLTFKNSIDIDFAYYWFTHIKNIIIETSSAATLPIINQTGIRTLPIRFPNITIQKKIVEYLNNLYKNQEELIEQLTGKLNQLSSLKSSLLDSAFKGEL